MKNEAIYTSFIDNVIQSLFLSDEFIKVLSITFNIKIPTFFGKKKIKTELRSQSIALGLFLIKKIGYEFLETASKNRIIEDVDYQDFQCVLTGLSLSDEDIWALLYGYLNHNKEGNITVGDLCLLQLRGSLWELSYSHEYQHDEAFHILINNITESLQQKFEQLVIIINNRK